MNWRKAQRRYREILIEIRQLLDGSNGNLIEAFSIIRALRLASPDYFDRLAIRRTREDAREILGVLGDLSGLLSSATMAPELRSRLGSEVLGTEYAGNSPAGRLMIALLEVRELCEEGDFNQPSTDQVKIWCARIAFSLMLRFSSNKLTSGSAGSPYRTLASLLYEVLTGEPGRDLKRACDDYLRAMRPAGL